MDYDMTSEKDGVIGVIGTPTNTVDTPPVICNCAQLMCAYGLGSPGGAGVSMMGETS